MITHSIRSTHVSFPSFVPLNALELVKCTNVVLADDKKTVLELHVEYDSEKRTKPKLQGVIHWVAEPSPGVEPLKVEVRHYDKPFKPENPNELEDWLGDFNTKSKVVITGAYGVQPLANAKEGDKFQFERLGYYCVDRDSTADKSCIEQDGDVERFLQTYNAYVQEVESS